MELTIAAKLFLLLIWPFFILAFFYVKDKEKFKQKVKKMFDKD